MPRLAKVVVWVLVFGGAAGVGAYIAAHSNPFPPGVEDPGAVHNPTVAPTAEPPEYHGSLRSFTYHQLYVGGRCTSRWRATFIFTVNTHGHVAGSGTASRDGSLACSFAVAQEESRTITLAVAGTLEGDSLRLRLTATQHSPLGSDDYGGFTRTVLTGAPGSVLPVKVTTGGNGPTGSTTIRLHRIDEEGRGTYVSVNRVGISCRPCAAAA